MRKVLLIILLIGLVVGDKSTCEEIYDSCKNETASTDSLGGWISSSYSKLLDRNYCADIFLACKKLK